MEALWYPLFVSGPGAVLTGTLAEKSTLAPMDADTKASLRLFVDALKATNLAIDGVRAHLAGSDSRADSAIRTEISAAEEALGRAESSLTD